MIVSVPYIIGSMIIYHWYHRTSLSGENTTGLDVEQEKRGRERESGLHYALTHSFIHSFISTSFACITRHLVHVQAVSWRDHAHQERNPGQ